MSSLPRISGKDAVNAFCEAGYSQVRISSRNHTIFKNDGVPVMLTAPPRKELKTGLLIFPIRDADMTVDEFLELL